MKKITLAAILLALASPLGLKADIITQLDSGSFTHLYEMNVNPSGQDSDGNSTSDFFAGTAGGQLIPQTYIGGLAFSDQNANPTENLFRTDFGGSITRNTLSGPNDPWTIEIRVRKESGAQASDGWFGVAMQNPGASVSTRVNIEDDRISYRAGASNNDFLIGTDFTSGFHTLRIAYEGNDSYFVWIDDQLLNADLTTASGFAGGNPSFNGNGAWFIGDFTGSIAGDWAVDYIRYQNGVAAAPNTIPEPTTLSLLTVLGIGLVYRRKR